MKNLLLIFISALLLASCSSSKTFNRGAFQKRRYTKGIYINTKVNIPIKNSKNETILQTKKGTDFIIGKVSDDKIAVEGDSVKVTLKNGEIYYGNKREETAKGILLLLKSGRTLFLLKREITEIDYINTKKTKTHYESNSYELTFEIKRNKKLHGSITKITKKEYHILTSSGETMSLPKQKVKSIYQEDNNHQETLHPDSLVGLLFFWIGTFAIVVGLASFTVIFGIGMLLLLIGAVLSSRGFKKTEEIPEKYNYRKAKRIKKIYTFLGRFLLTFFLVSLLLLVILLL